ncbi:MAG: YdeI/OmpD-associated family protein [Pedobacter sp.]|nr:YdeI/OmpD-associated family protein [Chitinophagaceae bacterium]
MPTNPAITTYISNAQPFAQPILNHIRELVHKACPEVEEKMKWSFPHFDYKGEMMCGMASFKQHCSFGFWKAKIMIDPILMANAETETAMGHLGKITSLKDLPSDKKIIAYIKEAMQLNDDGKKVPKPKRTTPKELIIPDYITEAISKNATALAKFQAFTPSHKKEYVLWIDEAKTDVTKQIRLAKALATIAEGKPHNWQYMDKYKKA